MNLKNTSIKRRRWLLAITTLVSALVTGCTGSNNDNEGYGSSSSPNDGPPTEGSGIEEDDIRGEVEVDKELLDECDNRVEVIDFNHEMDGNDLVVRSTLQNVADEKATVSDEPVSVEVFFNAESYNSQSSLNSTTLQVGENSELTMSLPVVDTDLPESYEVVVKPYCG